MKTKMAMAGSDALSSLCCFLDDLFSDSPINVKDKQLEAVDSILKGNDTLCILPTVYGKSLIYQVLPSAYAKMFPYVSDPVVCVLSPLIALITNQVMSANKLPESLGINAIALDLNNFKNVSSGKYNLTFGTPENFLNVQKWRDILGSEFFATNTVCIMIDEVHKVRWAESSKPFREAFGRINELHSLIKQDLPILALSATVDFNITKGILFTFQLC